MALRMGIKLQALTIGWSSLPFQSAPACHGAATPRFAGGRHLPSSMVGALLTTMMVGALLSRGPGSTSSSPRLGPCPRCRSRPGSALALHRKTEILGWTNEVECEAEKEGGGVSAKLATTKPYASHSGAAT
jgi:hypothetical protein